MRRIERYDGISCALCKRCIARSGVLFCSRGCQQMKCYKHDQASISFLVVGQRDRDGVQLLLYTLVYTLAARPQEEQQASMWCAAEHTLSSFML